MHLSLSQDEYRGTLIHSFLHAAGGPRFETISNECAKRTTAGTSDDTLYIYLRLGDRKFRPTTGGMMGFGLNRGKDALKCKYKQGIRKLVIVAVLNFAGSAGIAQGFATVAFHPTTEKVIIGGMALDAHQEAALEIGYTSVRLQSSLDPDFDFCTLVNAKHFAMSGAGLAKIVLAARHAREFPTADPPDTQGACCDIWHSVFRLSA